MKPKPKTFGSETIVSSKLCDEVVWLYDIKILRQGDGKADDSNGSGPQNPRPLHQNHLQTESTMLSFNPYCSSSKLILMYLDELASC